MKQLKSSLSDLRGLFERAVTVRDIAEPLVSFDASHAAAEARRLMEERDYDVVGVRDEGLVSGYVLREELRSGAIGEHRRVLGENTFLRESEPLVAAFQALRTQRYVFVMTLGHIGGIVTRGDLQKTPVRLWLFGLVSLLEMQMLRVLRERHPADSWTARLTAERLASARRVYDNRRLRNEAIGLSDCLQLTDKATILKAELFDCGGFESKTKLDGFLREIEDLRNSLAHSNDILSGRWPDLADLVTTLERVLERIETVKSVQL